MDDLEVIFFLYAFLCFSNFCKICTKYFFIQSGKTFNDHTHSTHRVTQEFFSAFQILRKRTGRAIMCFSSPNLENFSRNSIGSGCLVFSAAWWFSAPCQESEGFCRFFCLVLQNSVENVFLNNCLNWGLWNALSRIQWQLHSYLAALHPEITKEPMATPCVCVGGVGGALKSVCVVKCWRNARSFHGVILPSTSLCQIWASALVYRCLNFSPSELVSVCWKLKPYTS